jgi:hypothetical protein
MNMRLLINPASLAVFGAAVIAGCAIFEDEDHPTTCREDCLPAARMSMQEVIKVMGQPAELSSQEQGSMALQNGKE